MRRKTAQRIIINFCLALLLLLSTFMLITNITITSAMVCHSVSALLHFLLLSTFAWTAVQAFFLYKKAVRATKNRGSNRQSFYVCFVLAWGNKLLNNIPYLWIVILTLRVRNIFFLTSKLRKFFLHIFSNFKCLCRA